MPGIATYQNLRLQRAIPQNGHAVVDVGTRVEASDVVARGQAQTETLIFDVAAALDIPPSKAAAALAVAEGQDVQTGQVLAKAGWTGSRRLTAPVAGTVLKVDAKHGFLALRPFAQEVEVLAGIRGIVEAVTATDVVIGTFGHKVYGALGVGGEAFGTLKVLEVGDGPITAASISLQLAYSIVVATAPLTAEALRKALEIKVRGIVAPSIPVKELAQFLQIDPADVDPNALPQTSMPIMITEGFGNSPMAKPLADTLRRCEGQEGFLRVHQAAYERRSFLMVALPRPRGEMPSLPRGLVRIADPDLLGSYLTAGKVQRGIAIHDVANVTMEVHEEDGTSASIPVVDLEELSPLES